ncbi:MAG: AAA family ATPase [Actinobacteria bacterium]|nr:AAA family ATPase [Actinomycetota bacterium]
MVIWLNGTFGVGKTTTAALLAERLPGARVFDPEWVGYMLQANVKDQEYSDFQQLEPWRTLVPVVVAEIARWSGQDVVAPQSVLVEEYWAELAAGFAAQGLDVVHVVLDADRSTLEARIRADEVERQAEPWRLDHIGRYETARPWLHATADVVVPTDRRSPEEVAAAVLARVAV